MVLRSLHHNGLTWKCSFLGEQALLLEPETEKEVLQQVHSFSRVIEQSSVKGIVDVVPTYQSLGVMFDREKVTPEELQEALDQIKVSDTDIRTPVIHEVPTCYELGMDWEEVEAHTGLPRQTIIEKHSAKEYTVAMLGFIPGFLFLDGMDHELSCPRKSTPRTTIPSGSVGIGGRQTGIYSLESPGGWNIIGRTPQTFFDITKSPPSEILPGDKIIFKRVSESEFNRRRHD